MVTSKSRFRTKSIKCISATVMWIIHYSGLEFIYRKFNPPKNSKTLPTGIIWLLGIYIALFGIAFERYESRASEINYHINRLTEQLTTVKRYHALSQIPDIQWQPCPLKPIIFNPKSVFLSLFGEDEQYEEMANYLKNIIVENRHMLNSLNLNYCDLRGTAFSKGSFIGTTLAYSKLDQSLFLNVNFKNASFSNARFNYAWFNTCDFTGANLDKVNFDGAFFSNCNLKEAKGIKIEQLVKCRSLSGCELKPSWLKVLQREYPQKLNWPDGISSDKMSILLDRIYPEHFKRIREDHSIE